MDNVKTDLRDVPAYKMAYLDDKLMKRPELRGIRMELELMKTEMALSEHGVKSTVAIFGSARSRDKEEAEERVRKYEALAAARPGDKSIGSKLEESRNLLKSSKYYEIARQFTYLVATEDVAPGKRLITVTGGGPGIMEAANRGAHEGGSKNIGLNILLAHEQGPNPYISPEFCFNFHYFAIRKMHFVMRSKALVVFPGGFGTMDELFEVLTLVQTKKKNFIPIILVGREFWAKIFNFEGLVECGYIAREDLELFHITDTARETWDIIKDFYKTHEMPSNADME